MSDNTNKVKIGVSFEEKIGLKNYSNIQVGPIWVERYVDEGDEEHIKSEIKKLALVVEEFIAEERSAILESLG